MAAINKDVVLIVSLLLSVVSLVLLFGVTWYFQSSLDLLQQQVEYDRELLFKLQEQINVSIRTYVWPCIYMTMYYVYDKQLVTQLKQLYLYHITPRAHDIKRLYAKGKSILSIQLFIALAYSYWVKFHP